MTSPDPIELTKYEIEMLQILNGEKTRSWGSWMTPCLEFLSSKGLCTKGPDYQITEKGLKSLGK